MFFSFFPDPLIWRGFFWSKDKMLRSLIVTYKGHFQTGLAVSLDKLVNQKMLIKMVYSCTSPEKVITSFLNYQWAKP